MGKVHFSVWKGASLSWGKGFREQGPATAAFSLSHQISQLEAEYLTIMSKAAGDKVRKTLIWPKQVSQGTGAGLPWNFSAA